MSYRPPAGWQAENDKLFIHTSGVRLQQMTYRGEDGWYLVPVDLDQSVVKFDPTPEGRDKGFAAFGGGILGQGKPKAKPVAKQARGGRKKAIQIPEEEPAEAEPGEEAAAPAAAEEEADDEDDEDDEEEEEKEESAGPE